MHPIIVLPNVTLKAHGPISQAYLAQGLRTLHEACQWTQDLPYGPNTSSEDSQILFDERKGNCTTKHGAIARLAAEHNLPIYKNLGFYRLNDAIVTGVNDIIHPYGLDFIPQIHCFLAYENCRVDLTANNCNGKNRVIDDYDFVVPVAPDISRQQQQAYYLEYLSRYVEITHRFTMLSDATILGLLEACDRQVHYQCSIFSSELVTVG
ncbi:MAG: hypothetical protein AAGF66_18525 [Cyanobacteria bacterium P01_H01_bin.119]